MSASEFLGRINAVHAIVSLVLLGAIILIWIYSRKEQFITGGLRSDPQADLSAVEKRVGDLIARQQSNA